VAR
jgi:hypothetical protein